jgi:hypothetical protein
VTPRPGASQSGGHLHRRAIRRRSPSNRRSTRSNQGAKAGPAGFLARVGAPTPSPPSVSGAPGITSHLSRALQVRRPMFLADLGGQPKRLKRAPMRCGCAPCRRSSSPELGSHCGGGRAGVAIVSSPVGEFRDIGQAICVLIYSSTDLFDQCRDSLDQQTPAHAGGRRHVHHGAARREIAGRTHTGTHVIHNRRDHS